MFVGRLPFNMFFGLAVLCFAALPNALSEKVHERMTIEQVAATFQTSHDLVPDYEVVQFHGPRLNKRDGSLRQQLTVKAFGQDITLWLTLNDKFLAGKSTPVFKAKKNPTGTNIIYTKIPNAMLNAGKILEDQTNGASLVVATNSRGQQLMNGVIASRNLVVRSLPESITLALMQNRSSHDSESLESSETPRSTYHVVFKRAVKHSEGSFKSLAFDDAPSRVSRGLPVTPAPIPDVLYPEIMLVIDYNLYSLLGKNVDKVLSYALAFWNGVDLRYRSLQHPQFRFNIARFIIAESNEATPYIVNSMYDSELIHAYRLLTHTQEYYYSILGTFPASSYDAVVTMTSLELTTGDGDSDVLGIAGQSGACVVETTKELVRSVAIVTDDGSFIGIGTAAHEFAHLLSAGHDGEGPNRCRPADGYIMTDSTVITEHSHDFSSCSVQEIQRFLTNDKATCFYNKPRVANPLPRILPGRVRDRNHQCAALGRGRNCYTGAASQTQCTAIYCRDPEDPTDCERNGSFAPFDGAFCAQGKVCLHGKCVIV